jgi:hypothetical protein
MVNLHAYIITENVFENCSNTISIIISNVFNSNFDITFN